jgi:hypothetical protein
MRKRLNELNDKLEIESDAHGTSLRAVVPMSAMARPIPQDSQDMAFNHSTTADAFFMGNRTGLASSSEQAASGF